MSEDDWICESDSRKSSSSELSESSMLGMVKKYLEMRLIMLLLNCYDGGLVNMFM